jgi:hypothetical protein
MARHFIVFTISINSYFVVMQKPENGVHIKACEKKIWTLPVKEFIDMLPRLA